MPTVLYIRSMGWRAASRRQMMAGLRVDDSNRLVEILKSWNRVLQQSSRANLQPANTDEGKDGDAPCDSLPVAVRRRRNV